MIRSVRPGDAERIAELYNYYVLNTPITFEEEKLSRDEMKRRIVEYTARYPWIVYEQENEILGYAYAAKWRPRPAYRHSAEAIVYVDKDQHRKGIGLRLYEHLIADLRAMEVKVLTNSRSMIP
jgi:phosphinothricin acetyltransferase